MPNKEWEGFVQSLRQVLCAEDDRKTLNVCLFVVSGKIWTLLSAECKTHFCEMRKECRVAFILGSKSLQTIDSAITVFFMLKQLICFYWICFDVSNDSCKILARQWKMLNGLFCLFLLWSRRYLRKAEDAWLRTVCLKNATLMCSAICQGDHILVTTCLGKLMNKSK